MGIKAMTSEMKNKGFVQCFSRDFNMAKTPVMLKRGKNIETDDHLALESGKKFGYAGMSGG